MEQQAAITHNDIESQYSTSMPVIGAQCTRAEVIPGKTYTRANYPGNSLMQSLDYRNDISSAEDPNKVIQEKSDSNVPFIQNSKELASCKTADQTIKVLTGFMQSGFDDFEKRTGRRPTYSEMREMYG
jgi:hypothetical protein